MSQSQRLGKRMLEDLRVRNYATDTQRAYIDRVAKFVAHFKKPPAQLGLEHIRSYQVFLVEKKKCSWTMLNQTVCALRFFYGTTLGQEWSIEHIPYAKGEKKLPVVLSQGEAKKLLQAVDNMEHLTMTLLGYSVGLRVSEIANLELKDLDSARMKAPLRGLASSVAICTIVRRALKRRSSAILWRRIVMLDSYCPGLEAVASAPGLKESIFSLCSPYPSAIADYSTKSPSIRFSPGSRLHPESGHSYREAVSFNG